MKFNKKIVTFGAENVREALKDTDKYLDFSSLMVDTAMGSTEVYSKEERNDKIRNMFHSILGTDKNSSRKELRRAIRRNQVAIYEVIEETVENLLISGWGDNPFFNQFVETKNLASGDTNEFYVPDESILTVSEVSGGHHSLIRQRLGQGSRFSVTTKWYGVKIYAEYELFMSGHVDWAGFINKIYEAFDNKINGIVYSALMSAATQIVPNAQFNKTGAISESTKDSILTLVEDLQAATGHEIVIMGTRTALAKLSALTKIEYYSDDMKNERHTTGRLALWEGIRLIEIPQVFANGDTSKKLVDNTKLLFMPLADNRFIKLVNEGEADVKEVNDAGENMDMTYEYEYQQKFGVGVVINMLFGMWTITG